jgi:hypothetical protein
MKYLFALFLFACSAPKQTFTFHCLHEKYVNRYHGCVLSKETTQEIGVVCNQEKWTTWLDKDECLIMNEVDCDQFMCLAKVLE